MTRPGILIALLAACGSSSSSPDAAVGSDTLQADAAPDAPAGPVATVTVRRWEVAQPGVTVVFQDAAGAILGSATTDADGKATGPMVANGQVTAALGDEGARELVTYAGVQPGDQLVVVGRSEHNISITTPGGNPGGGISIIAGNFNCSTNAASVGTAMVYLRSDCITGTQFPVLATLVFGSSRYFSFKKANTPATSGTTSVTGLSAWTVGSLFTLSVANVPSSGTPSAYLGQVANNAQVGFLPETAFVVTAGAATTTFSTAIGYPDALQPELQIQATTGGGLTQHLSYAQRIAASSTSHTLDLAGGMLPQLLTVTATNATAARPVIAWTASASLAATDVGIAALTWSQPITAGNEDIVWTFIVPPGTASVTAPQLPATLAAFTPTSASTLAQPTVAFVDTDLLAGYDAARAAAATYGLVRVPLGEYANLQIPALPSSGTIRVTALSP